MDTERRKSEHAELRELVNALKTVIEARDAMWSLSIIDRLFRLDKYRKVISDYDMAMNRVRNAIQAVSMSSGSSSQNTPGNTPAETGSNTPVISLEEFSFLLGKPGKHK